MMTTTLRLIAQGFLTLPQVTGLDVTHRTGLPT
jgi:hypothetical protein